MREVDRLTDLDIRLGDGLAGLGRHHLDEPAAEDREHLANPIEQFGTGDARGACPVLTRGGCVVHAPEQHIPVRDGCGRQSRLPQIGVLAPLQDRAAPLAIDRDRRIGVRLVLERQACRRKLGMQPVLHAPGSRHPIVQLGQGCREPVGLAREDRRVIQFEYARHEVLARGVLLQASHQVADRRIELARLHDGRVEQQPAGVLANGVRLRGRHAQQHLHLDPVLHPALLGEQPGEREIEEVVARDADAHRIRVLRGERPCQQALVVGVGLLLARPGRQRPPVHRRIHILHREVGALDDAHLDARAALGNPMTCPRDQPVQRRDRVGQIGLQHDARLEVREGRLLEQRREDRDREVEVAVLLHVEVDELGAPGCRGLLVQGRQALHHAGDGLVEAPHRELADDRRDLDRDVVDVIPGQQLLRAAEPAARLAVAEHRLAQQIHIEPDAAGAQPPQRLAQRLRIGVDHEVRHHAAQHRP